MRVLSLLLLSTALCYAENANPGDFPYFALCKGTVEEYCAGIILTEELVVLSSECTYGLNSTDEVLIMVGNEEINDQTKTYTARLIEVDENYQDDPRAVDIGFLAVSEKFKFNSNIQPAKQIYKSNENETALKIVGFEAGKMKCSRVPAMQLNACLFKLYIQNEGILINTGTCVMRNSKETKPDYSYLLASDDGIVYGLPYFFSENVNGPDVFLVVDKYMDIINATIAKYESTK